MLGIWTLETENSNKSGDQAVVSTFLAGIHLSGIAPSPPASITDFYPPSLPVRQNPRVGQKTSVADGVRKMKSSEMGREKKAS